MSAAAAEPRGGAKGAAPDLSGHVISAFATPVVNYRWRQAEPVNEALRDCVLRLERSELAGLTRSNVGGWHSATTFLKRPDAAVKALRDYLTELVTALNRAMLPDERLTEAAGFELYGWANVLRFGEYHMQHTHPGSLWSGVYYVTDNPRIAGHPSSGKLELCDPRLAASALQTPFDALYGRFLLNPSAGQTVLFPSWLQHCVHPYFGDDKRISVAFNADWPAAPGR
ncbi:MAG: TIGR02466 family protein [Pseudomonadota bacterium]